MEYIENRQSHDADFWDDFAIELQALADKKPLSGVAQTALAELDAIAAPAAHRDSGLAELDRLIASFGPSEPVQYTPQSRCPTLLDRLQAESKIASNPIGEIASKSEGPKAVESVTAHSFVLPAKSVCPVRHPSPPLTPTYSPLHRHPLSTPVGASPLSPKTWKEASAADKLKASIALVGKKCGITFNLNLSPAQEKAMRASADPARHISDRINRQLKAAGIPNPEYAFALEVSPEGRLHLHGVVSPGPHDLTAIKQALVRAGGKIKGRAASRQLVVRSMPDAPGWNGYVTKDMPKTKHDLRLEKLTYISTPLRRLSREVLNAVEGCL